MHRLLTVTADAVALYLNTQIEAGAQAVMIFDSWGGVLADGAFQAFSLAYTRRVLAGLKRTHDGEHIPRIVFTKGGGLWLEQIAASDTDAVGLDWTMDLGRARALVGDRVALQGNMDPCVLFAQPEQIAAEARRLLDSYGPHPGHVFNLGHGISQHTPPESVSALVEAVRAHSRAMRRSA
jgi:uroporphyrinogen decarboxylase